MSAGIDARIDVILGTNLKRMATRNPGHKYETHNLPPGSQVVTVAPQNELVRGEYTVEGIVHRLNEILRDIREGFNRSKADKSVFKLYEVQKGKSRNKAIAPGYLLIQQNGHAQIIELLPHPNVYRDAEQGTITRGLFGLDLTEEAMRLSALRTEEGTLLLARGVSAGAERYETLPGARQDNGKYKNAVRPSLQELIAYDLETRGMLPCRGQKSRTFACYFIERGQRKVAFYDAETKAFEEELEPTDSVNTVLEISDPFAQAILEQCRNNQRVTDYAEHSWSWNTRVGRGAHASEIRNSWDAQVVLGAHKQDPQLERYGEVQMHLAHPTDAYDIPQQSRNLRVFPVVIEATPKSIEIGAGAYKESLRQYNESSMKTPTSFKR